MTTQQVVTTPYFLDNTAKSILAHAVNIIGYANDAEVGDQILVKPIGVTHDSDGWPLQRWQVTYLGAPS